MSQGLEGLLAGRTLVKRYHIEEVVGRGGFAVVYRATDTRLGRPVAVKVITLTAEDPEQREQLRERLHREARAAASLPHHPNLVTVHDVGTDPELGLDFLVMELLQGENLSQALQRGRPPLARALRILRDAAEGLAVGHRAGLVHRDVKPGNIFLAAPHQTDDPDAYRVCLLDYGIAQVIEDDQTVTRGMGANPLSPAFASPEQLQGGRDLSPATDVFSLGVVGYQLLTGERPFATEAGQAPAGWTVRAPVHELNPEVPLGVEAVLMRAMSVRPEERFVDADAMGEALDLAMADDETQRLAAKAHSPGIGVLPADEDDETILAPAPVAAHAAAAGAAAGTGAGPQRPMPPLRPPSRGKPRRRGMPLVLIAAVLLAAVAAWAAFSSGGEGDRADAARAAGDTLADGSPQPVVDDAGLPVETGAVPPRTAVEVNVPPGSVPAGGTAPGTSGPAAPSTGAPPAAGAPQQPQQPAGQPQQPAQPPAQQPAQPPAQPAQQPAQQPPPQPVQPPAQEPRQPPEPPEPPPRPRPDPPLLGRPVTPSPPAGPRDTIFIPTPGGER